MDKNSFLSEDKTVELKNLFGVKVLSGQNIHDTGYVELVSQLFVYHCPFNDL